MQQQQQQQAVQQQTVQQQSGGPGMMGGMMPSGMVPTNVSVSGITCGYNVLSVGCMMGTQLCQLLVHTWSVPAAYIVLWLCISSTAPVVFCMAFHVLLARCMRQLLTTPPYLYARLAAEYAGHAQQQLPCATTTTTTTQHSRPQAEPRYAQWVLAATNGWDGWYDASPRWATAPWSASLCSSRG